jgi:threonine/homoserine/homoserine lactone efflux protein
MVLLAAAWAIYEVFYYSLYVWCVQRLRTFFSRRKVRRRMEQISGTVMLGLAVRMVVENS